MFLSSFYCYLNHDNKNDFIIELKQIFEKCIKQEETNLVDFKGICFTLQKRHRTFICNKRQTIIVTF
jgi:hypothetical protein